MWGSVCGTPHYLHHRIVTMEVYKCHYNWVRRIIIPGAYKWFVCIVNSYAAMTHGAGHSHPWAFEDCTHDKSSSGGGRSLSPSRIWAEVKIVLTPSILAVGRSFPPLSCWEEDRPHLNFYHLLHAKNWGEASLVSWPRPAFHYLQAMKGWAEPENKPLLHVVYCKQSRAGGGSGLQ